MGILKTLSNGVKRISDSLSYYDKWENKSKMGLHGEVLVVAKENWSVDPVTGVSQVLGEPIVRKRMKPNQILLGGSLFALEKMFNVSATLNVEYLNNIMGIGTTGPVITEKYPKDNGLCLWTVGLGGCGDARKDVVNVYQQQRALNNIIPFRVVDEYFDPTSEEAKKYFLAKQMSDGRIAYYGKKFEKTPIVTALWKDAAKDLDGSPVVESDYTSTKSVPIEVFAECVCQLEAEDFREYFNLYDKIEDARFNEIGLTTGILSETDDGRPEYKQVRQASCCHFTNEPLHMEKDMIIIYRWFSA